MPLPPSQSRSNLRRSLPLAALLPCRALLYFTLLPSLSNCLSLLFSSLSCLQFIFPSSFLKFFQLPSRFNTQHLSASLRAHIYIYIAILIHSLFTFYSRQFSFYVHVAASTFYSLSRYPWRVSLSLSIPVRRATRFVTVAF